MLVTAERDCICAVSLFSNCWRRRFRMSSKMPPKDAMVVCVVAACPELVEGVACLPVGRVWVSVTDGACPV